MAASGMTFGTIASAPTFMISAPNIQITGPGGLSIKNLTFQELGGINSEVKVEQYVSTGTNGGVLHTKQFGLTQPPSVTLKRGVDQDLSLWYWHLMAVSGDPKARGDVTLEMYAAGVMGGAKPLLALTLHSAWCAKINISSAKAGEGMVTQDVVIACDQITPEQ